MVKKTTRRSEPVAGSLAKFFFATVGLTTVIVVVGYVPTTRLGGETAVAGMLAGCAVSLAGSWIGSIPIFVALKAQQGAINAALASMAIRFVVVGAGAVAIALTGAVEKGPFLVWVAISYMALLVADVMLALKCSSGSPTKQRND